MGALFTININLSADLTATNHKLDKILENMARTKQEFKDLAQEVRTAFANIADDITRLTDALQRTDLTEAEEEEIYGEFRELADQANTLAGRTPEAPTEPEA